MRGIEYITDRHNKLFFEWNEAITSVNQAIDFVKQKQGECNLNEFSNSIEAEIIKISCITEKISDIHSEGKQLEGIIEENNHAKNGYSFDLNFNEEAMKILSEFKISLKQLDIIRQEYLKDKLNTISIGLNKVKSSEGKIKVEEEKILETIQKYTQLISCFYRDIVNMNINLEENHSSITEFYCLIEDSKDLINRLLDIKRKDLPKLKEMSLDHTKLQMRDIPRILLNIRNIKENSKGIHNQSTGNYFVNLRNILFHEIISSLEFIEKKLIIDLSEKKYFDSKIPLLQKQFLELEGNADSVLKQFDILNSGFQFNSTEKEYNRIKEHCLKANYLCYEIQLFIRQNPKFVNIDVLIELLKKIQSKQAENRLTLKIPIQVFKDLNEMSNIFDNLIKEYESLKEITSISEVLSTFQIRIMVLIEHRENIIMKKKRILDFDLEMNFPQMDKILELLIPYSSQIETLESILDYGKLFQSDYFSIISFNSNLRRENWMELIQDINEATVKLTECIELKYSDEFIRQLCRQMMDMYAECNIHLNYLSDLRLNIVSEVKLSTENGKSFPFERMVKKIDDVRMKEIKVNEETKEYFLVLRTYRDHYLDSLQNFIEESDFHCNFKENNLLQIKNTTWLLKFCDKLQAEKNLDLFFLGKLSFRKIINRIKDDLIDIDVPEIIKKENNYSLGDIQEFFNVILDIFEILKSELNITVNDFDSIIEILQAYKIFCELYILHKSNIERLSAKFRIKDKEFLQHFTSIIKNQDACQKELTKIMDIFLVHNSHQIPIKLLKICTENLQNDYSISNEKLEILMKLVILIEKESEFSLTISEKLLKNKKRTYDNNDFMNIKTNNILSFEIRALLPIRNSFESDNFEEIYGIHDFSEVKYFLDSLASSKLIDFFNLLADIFKQADNFQEIEKISNSKKAKIVEIAKNNPTIEKILAPMKKDLGI